MVQIIQIPQRKIITRSEQPQPQLPADYKIVSEPNYTSNGEKLIIEHQNKAEKKTNKIIVNDDLKNHIWDVFESPFHKVSKIF